MQNRPLSDWVDPNIGTIGHLLTATKPLVHLPHGMAQIMPITDPAITDRYTADLIYGFPLNQCSVMADAGEHPRFVSQFDHDLEKVRCYRGEVLLEDSGVWAEYTASQHGAVYSFQFPGKTGWLEIKRTAEGAICARDGQLYTGWQDFRGVKCYFAAQLSCRPEAVTPHEQGVVLRFAPGTRLVVRVGFSYIDEEQALDNLERELADRTFDEVAESAQRAWEQALGRIEVKGGTDAQKRTFYTALYRVHRRMVNITEYGRYYSGFDGRVHRDDRDFYVDDGIWDTYRGAHPLQLLLEPKRQMDIISSYLRMYRQTGWLPSFPHLQGPRAVMLGKHATAMIADTYMKGYRGFDEQLAYEAMKKNADEATKLPWTAGGLTEYDQCYFEKGFFPALPEGEEEPIERAHPFERRQCVAVTLECSYDDWCLSQMARALGHEEDAQRYARRGQNYRNLFNPETQFMSPRTADGEWVPGFDPKLSGGQGGRAYFAECNAWTYTMHVQHDVKGLAELFGGEEHLAARLDAMFREQYGTSKYAFLGQFPDSTGLIGQYCMGNEPSFHIPYLYNLVGQPYKTQRKLREIMRLWYNDTPFGICGDEDGGAMCAWYVFSAMGFYPFCPGKPEYQVGSPIFDEVKIHLEDGKTFTIRAENQGEANKYIQSASLNGQAFDTTRLPHEAVVQGGTLVFTMGGRPNVAWGTHEETLV